MKQINQYWTSDQIFSRIAIAWFFWLFRIDINNLIWKLVALYMRYWRSVDFSQIAKCLILWKWQKTRKSVPNWLNTSPKFLLCLDNYLINLNVYEQNLPTILSFFIFQVCLCIVPELLDFDRKTLLRTIDPSNWNRRSRVMKKLKIGIRINKFIFLTSFSGFDYFCIDWASNTRWDHSRICFTARRITFPAIYLDRCAVQHKIVVFDFTIWDIEESRYRSSVRSALSYRRV